MNESSASGDIFAIVFLVGIFLVLFVLPFWLLMKHYRKSQNKIRESAKTKPIETKAQIEKREREHKEHIVSVLCILAGIGIGSKILGNVFLGLILAIAFGSVARLIMSRMSK